MSQTFTAQARSFKAFNANVARAITAEQNAATNANAAVLRAVTLAAMMRPGATVNAVVEAAYDGFGSSVDNDRPGRVSMARKVVSYLRAQAKVPAVTVGEGEADTLAKVEALCAQYTLRGLYDAARVPAKAKAAETKVERDTAKERAEADAREAAGVTGPVAWSVSGLQTAVSPVIQAAERGEPDALATLEALRAMIAAAIVTGEAAVEAAKAAEQAPVAKAA